MKRWKLAPSVSIASSRVFPISSTKRETPAFESSYWTVGEAAELE